MNHQVMERADAIARQISASDAAARYWQAKAKMDGHTVAQDLFEELKLKQNASLILQQRLDSQHPKVMLAEMAVQELENKLYGIPVAMQYKEAQSELNELVQGVVQVLLTRLTGQLPVELGPRQGCGKGHDGNGCSCGND